MIIKGKARAGARALGRYLSEEGKNERIRIFEVRGTVASDPFGAITEMAAHAECTRCAKPLYHGIISPAPPHVLSDEQWMLAVDLLEKELGFSGQPRVIVIHCGHDGREHAHVVWSRIDLDRQRAIPISHNYRKHELVARELERRFGHERVQGMHVERDAVKRPERAISSADLEQGKRTGLSSKQVTAEVTAAFRASDGPEAFRAALDLAGYVLAAGDRRDFVVIDPTGGVHSLARRIECVTTAGLREFMTGLDLASLPRVDEAKQIVAERRDRPAPQPTADIDPKLEKGYGRGEDYVSQATAAQKDFEKRQRRLIDRFLDERDMAPDILEPDRQHTAPGGGRARSR